MTRMPLNPARSGTLRYLSSAQRVHAAVMAAFPNHHTHASRVLWRLDQPARHDVSLLMVSAEPPDLTHVIEQAGWPTRPDATWQTKAYQPFLDRLAADQTWAFRLRANPVVRRRGSDDRITSLPHVTVEQQTAWLTARHEHLGVVFSASPTTTDGPGVTPALPSVMVSDRRTDRFERRSSPPERGRAVTIATVRFDGVLTVADPDRLRHALVHGVGRAKAYGCGLLTLAARPS